VSLGNRGRHRGLVPVRHHGQSPTLSAGSQAGACTICSPRPRASALPCESPAPPHNSTDEAIGSPSTPSLPSPTPPCWSCLLQQHPTQEALFQQFQSSPMPRPSILLYNVAAAYRRDRQVETVIRLSRVGTQSASRTLSTTCRRLSPSSRPGMASSSSHADATRGLHGAGCCDGLAISDPAKRARRLCGQHARCWKAREPLDKGVSSCRTGLCLAQGMFCDTSPVPVKYAAELDQGQGKRANAPA